jgi:putative ABC transport system substrate-binding protein
MRRREFMAALAGAVAWPFAVRAQQPGVAVIGYLGSETPELFATRLRSFRQGLSATGYDEGRNVAIEYRWAEGNNDRLPALAADLVRRQVAVIVTPAASSPHSLQSRQRLPSPSSLKREPTRLRSDVSPA